jgi:hypothetical protein
MHIYLELQSNNNLLALEMMHPCYLDIFLIGLLQHYHGA